MLLSNDGAQVAVAVLEPWGEEVAVRPGSQVEVLAVGPAGGELEVEVHAGAADPNAMTELVLPSWDAHARATRGLPLPCTRRPPRG